MTTPAQSEFDGLFNPHDRPSPTHPEDRDAASDQSFSDHDGTTLQDQEDIDDDDDDTAAVVNEKFHPSSTSTTTMPAASYLPHTSQFDANTGPKGVIADARSFETAKKRSFRQTLYALAGEAPQIFSKTPSRTGEKAAPGTTADRSPSGNRNASQSPSPDLSDSEDEFMRTWRAGRLAQIANAQQEMRNTRRHSPTKRHYGTMISVDPAGYLDAIEKVGADTTVVVLIYDDESAVSSKVEDALSALARKYPTTRFVKLHFLEAEMDEVAAPGIIAYRGGECFANLVSVLREIPAGREIGRDSVEKVLLQHRIL